jgi:hypothetical protein
MPDVSKISSFTSNPLYMIILIIAIAIYLFMLYFSISTNDENASSKNFLTNIFIIVLPIITLLCVILLITEQTYGRIVIVGTVFAISICAIIYYFLISSVSQYIFNKYLFYLVVGLIIIIGLTIIVTVISYNFRKATGWSGFFVNLLFYIPCLIRDAIRVMTQEYQNTSSTIFILFIFQILLILMYFYLFPLIDTAAYPSSILLLNEPVMLNKKLDISNNHKLIETRTCLASDTNNKCLNENIKIQNINRSFAISMWVYVNPAPKTKLGYNKKTPIFTLSEPNANTTYLSLDFENNEDTKTLFSLFVSGSQLTDEISLETINPIPLNMKLQRWNNIVFNYTNTPIEPTPTSSTGPYTSTILDIFINGKLNYSVNIDNSNVNNIPEFNNKYTIKVGDGTQNKNLDGIYGSLCNLVYYSKPLSKLSIVYNYNRLIYKNPPIL